MKRFEVFRNPSPKSARAMPYLVLLQSELLDELPTRVVAPLATAASLGGRGAARLNPHFEIEGEVVFLLTQQIGAVPTGTLKARVTSLDEHRDSIVGALDLLFSGV